MADWQMAAQSVMEKSQPVLCGLVAVVLIWAAFREEDR